MRKYPDCAYNGDFYCDFVYDPDRPWVWVDFRFFHTSLKRYFAVAMMTTAYDAYCEAETRALCGEWKTEELAVSIKRQLGDPVLNRPKIEVKDYGRVAVGLWVTVNSDHIDEHVIRKFIQDFRALGEPTKPGWSWYGEETQVDCRKFF